MDEALQQEIEGGNLSRVQWLTKFETRPEILNEALHFAAAFNQPKIVDFFLNSPDIDVDTCHGDYGTRPLHKACEHGSVEMVEMLLEHGATIEAVSRENKWTVLHFAAKGNHVDVLNLLMPRVSPGMICNIDEDGATALHLAARYGSTEAAVFLVDQYIHQEKTEFINCYTNEGQSPLHCAIESRILALVELFMDWGASPDIPDMHGLTPFAMAVHTGHLKICSFLLERGAEVRSHEGFGGSVLHIAAANGHVGIVDLLVAHGADLNCIPKAGILPKYTPLQLTCEQGNLEMVRHLVEQHHVHIETAADEAQLPLHIAVLGCQTHVVAYLLEQGADPNRGHGSHGRSTLHYAVEMRQEDLVSLLILHGVDVNSESYFGETPLHIAAAFRDMVGMNILMILLDSGANVNRAAEYNGMTALHIASTVEVISALLRSGADVSTQDRHGLTALHVAVKRGDIAAIKLLLEHGADTEAENTLGYTSLHTAAERGNPNVVSILLNEGSNVRAFSAYRMTPLHLAVRDGNKECALLLLERGADIRAQDHRGRSSLHLAAEQGRSGFIDELLQRGGDLRQEDNDGNTALILAATNNRADAV
eukprot:CAMPEP_0172452406 /NCGR_PEP_ID=MMETSP1065-20121228/10080_1 /TAXON_ID=265537 /ORGANISM="Amphiprora paludosa, Strain CCMP125" /LENGTH=592 /DNA_ID=CAMNT_0013204459 /DNA_START=54 /DNA_END=1829 /DNA_ORIENTATION=+